MKSAVLTELKEVRQKREFYELTRHQKVNITQLMTKLKYGMTDRERIEYLGKTHPSICIFILIRLDMN